MEIVYILLIAIAFSVEISTKVNTTNIAKKISIGLIIVGALIHLAGRENGLIEIGILGFLSADFIIHVLCKDNRRKEDHFNERVS